MTVVETTRSLTSQRSCVCPYMASSTWEVSYKTEPVVNYREGGGYEMGGGGKSSSAVQKVGAQKT